MAFIANSKKNFSDYNTLHVLPRCDSFVTRIFVTLYRVITKIRLGFFNVNEKEIYL